MKKEYIISVSIIVGFIIIALAIYFKPQPIQKNEFIKFDIKDRENGICADMYKEGYDWGLGQIPLQFNIWQKIEGKNDNLTKELLFDMLKNWKSNN